MAKNSAGILTLGALAGLGYLLLRPKSASAAEPAPAPSPGPAPVPEPEPEPIPDCGPGYVYDAVARECVPTQVDVPPTPPGLLKRGSSGPKVVALQRKLCAFWRSLGPVNPQQFGTISWDDFDDGQYGPGTEASVADAQAQMGIAVDGDAGPQTQGALNQYLASIGLDPAEVENTSCAQWFDS